MKQSLILIGLLLSGSFMFSQPNQDKWEGSLREDEKGNMVLISEDENGNTIVDSVLVLAPGQKPPANVKYYLYRDAKKRMVSSNGKYEYIWRLGENNQMLRDSVLVED